MTFLACIENALKAKKITGKKAEEVKELYTNLFDSYVKSGMGRGDAEAAAIKASIMKADAEVSYRVRGRVKDQEIALRFNERLKTFKGGDFGLAAQSILEQDARAMNNGNYVARREKYRGMFHAAMDEAIQRFSTKAVGLYRPVQGLENIIRELYGVDSGDASAKAIASAWTKANDLGVELWNHHGGALLKRLDWRIPQLQSAVKLTKTGQKEWVADHTGWLDWSKIRRSDGRLIPEAEREGILKDVFNTIKTDGKWRPPEAAGHTPTANMLDASRFLVFKDADAWLNMHAKYGDGSVFDVMIHHMDDRAHHLAMLETFGRNPEAARDLLKAQAMHLAGFADAQVTGPAKTRSLDGVVEGLKTFDDMFDKVTRKNTVGAENSVAHFMGGLRNVITANVLASASLAAIPGDTFTAVLARHQAGLPWVQGFGKYLRAMNPLDTEVRSLARRAGLVDDMSATMAYAAQRFSMLNTYGPSWTKRLSDVTLRASLLTPHTQAARWAHGLEWMGFMHDMKGRAFADLPFQKTLAKYGITASDWDAFRAIQSWQPQPGSEFLRPSDILSGKISDKAIALHDKFMTLIVDESKLAVPDATLRAAVALKGSTRPGTMLGELAASGAMFKNFPVTVAFLYGREALAKSTLAGKASYVAAFGLGMTTVGALGVQLSELANGRDPIPMDQPAFWGKAMLKGGAMGAFGDFVFADVNSYGNGLPEQLAGPVASMVSDLKDLTIGNAYELFEGKDAHIAADTARFATHLIPGKSIWYGRLVMDRLFTEQVLRAVDPKFASKAQRRITTQKQNFGNSYFWPPGQTSPQRGPQLP